MYDFWKPPVSSVQNVENGGAVAATTAATDVEIFMLWGPTLPAAKTDLWLGGDVQPPAAAAVPWARWGLQAPVEQFQMTEQHLFL